MNAFLLSTAFLSLAPLTSAQGVSSTTTANAQPAARQTLFLGDLAGEPLPAYPYFQWTRTFHQGSPVHIAVDPTRTPHVVGRTADVYVVPERGASGWAADRTLPPGNLATTVTFSATDVQSNTWQVNAGTLNGSGVYRLGRGYDVVVDLDQDGTLNGDDLIDGLEDEAGFYCVRNTSGSGTQAVTSTTYSGGALLGQETFWPLSIGFEPLPIVVISHGNGHNYLWYDHLGEHLASYGYLVISHQNNTGPGPSAASLSTLQNIDYFLDNLDTIQSGLFAGKVDSTRITLIGHSRGGEGVIRAYTRLVNDEYTSPNFDDDDIVLISSIAPTSFLVASLATPLDQNFHLFYGAADTDVSGRPATGAGVPFVYPERATGNKHVHYMHGVGHAYFHNGSGCWCGGPDLLTRAQTHAYEKGVYVPLIEHYVRDSAAGLDFLERMDLDLRPDGTPAGVTVATEYRVASSAGAFVIDDYQTETAVATSSSGGAVTTNVAALVEGQMRDTDGSFVYSAAVPLNGMTRWNHNLDDPRCAVFTWTTPGSAFYELEVIPAARDLRPYSHLSFRACQGTRHPETDALDSPLTFTVTLRDTHGTTSSISFENYGSITRTYERTGQGAGAGWANEFNTVRLRLTDFLTNGSALDLTSVEAVRFEFGAGFGSERGRLGLDDVELLPR